MIRNTEGFGNSLFYSIGPWWCCCGGHYICFPQPSWLDDVFFFFFAKVRREKKSTLIQIASLEAKSHQLRAQVQYFCQNDHLNIPYFSFVFCCIENKQPWSNELVFVHLSNTWYYRIIAIPGARDTLYSSCCVIIPHKLKTNPALWLECRRVIRNCAPGYYCLPGTHRHNLTRRCVNSFISK